MKEFSLQDNWDCNNDNGYPPESISQSGCKQICGDCEYDFYDFF